MIKTLTMSSKITAKIHLRDTYRDYFVAETVHHGTFLSKGLDMTIQIQDGKVVDMTRLVHRPYDECRHWSVTSDGCSRSFQASRVAVEPVIIRLLHDVATAVARHRHLHYALYTTSSGLSNPTNTMGQYLNTVDEAADGFDKLELLEAALEHLDPRAGLHIREPQITATVTDAADDGSQ